jgi:hypothetical protein
MHQSEFDSRYPLFSLPRGSASDSPPSERPSLSELVTPKVTLPAENGRAVALGAFFQRSAARIELGSTYALSHLRRALIFVNYRPTMEGSRMFFLNGASED